MPDMDYLAGVLVEAVSYVLCQDRALDLDAFHKVRWALDAAFFVVVAFFTFFFIVKLCYGRRVV
jgi:hypothetical protein